MPRTDHIPGPAPAAVPAAVPGPASAPTAAEFAFPLVRRTGYLLHKAGVLLMHEADRALESRGMRMRYFYVLAALEGGPSLSQQDLSGLLNLDPTTMVALIDEMESAGHVERRRNPADRRRYILDLTDAGREALLGASRAVEEVEQDFLSAVPAADRERLRDILGEVLADRWPSVISCE
ncbi:MarR family winged helix-turn-helix transcriptional regulator [Streptomyces sp. H27-D2]|uniref:MarR family winged helix-turn-helix transcriptional regulator n=1 Tax=Streptomyces sp. H27-D2 TaxID=3046304 RepID=UPI002DC021E2|nr:MarR family winged helix-turn-helix transcriptional regulator [Streptomyces sp. H27-D2]MEC4017865.1 MarR family winged helix-turn-helix transcriptional regulator [Streptomyces sp. H27-D2]